MNRKFTALLLCALLFSTFAHEHQRAHQINQHARIHDKHESRSHHLSHIQNRDNGDPSEECSWVCPTGPGEPPGNVTEGPTTGPIIGPTTGPVGPPGGPGPVINITGGLTVIVNETSNIIAVVNITANVALAIDISANLVAIFNGTSGAVVIINIGTQSGYLIRAGVSLDTWISSHGSFADYINSIVSLRVVLELAARVGVSFNLSTVTDVVLHEIAGVLIHLSAQYAAQLRISVTASLSILLQISARITVLFQGSLRGFLTVVGSAVVVIRGDIIWLTVVLEGLAQLFVHLQGGLQVLIGRSIRLSLQVILTAKSGIDVLIYILTVISVHVNLSVVLGGLLNNVELLLGVIVQLGGNIYIGLNGLLYVVYTIIAVINGHLSIEVLIDVLIRFSVSGRSNVSLTEELNVTVVALLNVTQSQNSNGTLQALVSFLISLRDHNLIVGGVNISAIIAILVQVGVIAALDLVIRVLVAIRAVIQIEISVPQLLLSVLQLLNTTIGINIVLVLIPSIRLNGDIDINGTIDIIALILRGVNIRAILLGGLTLDNILSHLPVVGDIYVAISAALRAALSVNLSVILGSSAARSIVIRIWAWLTAALHFNFNIGGILGGTGSTALNGTGSTGGSLNGTGIGDGGGIGTGDGGGTGSGNGSVNGTGGLGGSWGGGLGGSWGGSWGGGGSYHIGDKEHKHIDDDHDHGHHDSEDKIRHPKARHHHLGAREHHPETEDNRHH